MVVGKLPGLGRPVDLDNRAMAYCAYSRCGWALYRLFSFV